MRTLAVLLGVVLFSIPLVGVAADEAAQDGARTEPRILGLLSLAVGKDAKKAALARRLLDREDAEAMLAALVKCMHFRPAALRVESAGRLAALKDARALPALLERAVKDDSAEVRHACADAVRAIGAKDAIVPLARALYSDSPISRRHAAEALGRIGDTAAMPWLERRLASPGPEVPRAHVTVTSQLTYLRDFDTGVC